MSNRVLFCNGPLRGQWQTVPGSYHEWRVRQVADFWVTNEEWSDTLKIEETTYHIVMDEMSFFGTKLAFRVAVTGPPSEWGQAILDTMFQRDVVREFHR